MQSDCPLECFDEEVVPGRSATIDGSRAFQRPDHRRSYDPRRGATVDGDGLRLAAPGFMRRDATRGITGGAVRGLKPTATIMTSPRDEEAATALAVALKQNAFTKAYLLGHRRLPKHPPDSYAPGSKEEAACFAGDLQLAWNAHPAAKKWLASRTGKT